MSTQFHTGWTNPTWHSQKLKPAKQRWNNWVKVHTPVQSWTGRPIGPWAGPGRDFRNLAVGQARPEIGWAGPGREAHGPGRQIWGFVQLCTRYTVTDIFWDYRAHRFHISKHPLCYPITGNNLVGFQLNITHTFLETQSVRITTFYFILRTVY